MTSQHWREALNEWRVQWRVGVAAFLCLGCSFGAFHAISSLFVLPLQQEFGWTRGQIAVAQNASLAAALASPFLGRAIDRVGVRKLMLGGMSISVLLYLCLAAMNGSLILYYVLYTLAAVIGLTASGLTCSRVVSEAFERSRGLSLAIARSGLSVTSAVLPATIFAVITAFGWRAGYVGLSVLVAMIALPSAFFWIGRTPASCGTSRTSVADLPSMRQLLRDRRVLKLCVAAGLGYAPATALMTQLQPLLIGKGIAAADAAGLVGLAGVASLAGAILTGALVDRYWAPGIAFLFACGSAAGTLLFAFEPSMDGWTATGAIVLIGLGLGAEIDVVAFLVGRYFGIPTFASIYGMVVLSIAVVGAVGASLLGIAFDHYGSYDPALLAIAGSFLGAGLVYLTLGGYPALPGREVPMENGLVPDISPAE